MNDLTTLLDYIAEHRLTLTVRRYPEVPTAPWGATLAWPNGLTEGYWGPSPEDALAGLCLHAREHDCAGCCCVVASGGG